MEVVMVQLILPILILWAILSSGCGLATINVTDNEFPEDQKVRVQEKRTSDAILGVIIDTVAQSVR
jgi:hypothetical protein